MSGHPSDPVTPSRFRQIRQVFESALHQADSERAGFVEKACGEDLLLLKEVRRMLAGHREGESVLDGMTPASPIQPGTQFAGYIHVSESIGRGGMGIVYRGRDLKLNREVALKILPESFASDADRIARFQREARTLASLNHPNIGAIYGFENSNGVHALVLELVEGPTLQDRIELGRITPEEAVPIARQIAEALEAAHERGVIHRDLKPANVKLRPDGVVKVLDFGLAKSVAPRQAGRDAEADLSTRTIYGGTEIGVILGTPSYMPPEQALGAAVDRRADIWAFGAVLYEMLSGRRLFAGEEVAATLAAVVRQEIDWSAIPLSTSQSLRTLMARCLDRDVRRRLRDIGEARILLEDPAALAPAKSNPVTFENAKPRWRVALPLLFAVLLTATLVSVGWWFLKPSVESTVTRFTFLLPKGQELSAAPGGHTLALSPDGTQLVFAAIPPGRLFLRSMAKLELTPLEGSQGYTRAIDPVFSPDGQWIAFFAQSDRTIKKIPVAGGTAATICQAENPLGMSWGAEGILFAQSNGILQVPSDGGNAKMLVEIKQGEIAHGPEMLSDGEHVLFSLASINEINRWDKASIVVQSIRSGKRTTLLRGGSEGRYVKTGHIVYVVAARLFSVAFDLKRLEVKGSPIVLVEGIRRSSDTGAAQYSFSDNGTLAYTPGPAAAFLGGQLQLALINRRGEIEELKLPRGQYLTPRASPDGTRIAFGTDDGKEAIVWTYDLSGKSAMRRLTSGSNNRFPVWSADSQRLTFQSDREGDLALYWQPADGASPAERLTTPMKGTSHVAESWSPNGETLLYSVSNDSDQALWMYSRKEKSLREFGVHSKIPTGAVFSPDGRWVAYSSGQEGSSSVFVQPFPPTGASYQLVARESSFSPHEVVWSPDGKELFYNPRPNGFESVPVITKPVFSFGNPIDLPRPFQLVPPSGRRFYDVLPDGRFLGLIREDYGTPLQINIVTNWFAELRALAPTAR